MNQLLITSNDIVDNNKNALQTLSLPSDNPCSVYFYISDIHLDYKIGNGVYPKRKKFTGGNEDREFIKYVAKSIRRSYKKIREALPLSNLKGCFILLNGDISCDYDQLDYFFEEYTKISASFPYNLARDTIFVPGNHELWSQNSSLDEMHSKLFDLVEKKYGMTFLQGEMLLWRNRFYKTDKYIVSCDEFKELSISKLQEYALHFTDFILGGTGFSGYNKNHNAVEGNLYRGTIKTLDEDIEKTRVFERIYDKVSEALEKDSVVCFTHNPVEDWSEKQTYNKNWFYVNGHTHKNQLIRDEEKTVFADNQVGYKDHNYSLKWFIKDASCNIFRYYEDGKHSITKELYIKFNSYLGIYTTINRKNITDIIMLKNKDIFMFFVELENRYLYMLDGGRIQVVYHDLDYYYENMATYYEAICIGAKPVQDALEKISRVVKSFGGDGTIHGSIVDINFLNHIYLNPVDGSTTAYYAESIVDKIVYPSIDELLRQRLPGLHKKYLLLNGGDNKEKENNNLPEKQDSAGTYVRDTSMYSASRLLKKMQYTYNKKIIRTWDDILLRRYKEKIKEENELIE